MKLFLALICASLFLVSCAGVDKTYQVSYDKSKAVENDSQTIEKAMDDLDNVEVTTVHP